MSTYLAMKLTVVVSSLVILFTVGLSSCGEIDDLINAARIRWCPSSSKLDHACITSLIQGYFTLFDLCQPGFTNCDLCSQQTRYITTKIPLIKNEYTSSDFMDISIAMAISVTEQQFACSATNNGTINGYMKEAVKTTRMVRGAEEWIDNVYTKMANGFETSSFNKCITFKSIVTQSNPLSLTNGTSFVTPVLGKMVLHQMSGYLMSRDCDMLPPPQMVLNSLYHFMGLSSTKDLVMESNLRKIVNSLKVGITIQSTESNHDHHHHAVDTVNAVNVALSTLNRQRRSTEQLTQCLPLGNIYAIHNYNKTAGLNTKQFINVIPTLLQQSTSNSCNIVSIKAINKISTVKEKYGWGTLSVAIICLCSVFGLVLVPLGSKHYFQMFIVFFVALGVGTLVGDAVLHLIPEAMGFHVDDPIVIWKLIGCLMSLLAMFVMENVITLCKKKRQSQEDDNHDGHSHAGHSHMPNFEDLTTATIMTGEKSENNAKIAGPKAPISAAIMVILGETIHNFADGLALGAAFTSSLQKGISTSIAIFCHELPHELGDFAILLAAGFKWKWALLANLLSSFTAFAGLYVGLAISGESPLTQQIIFTITSGMFLYVALTDMLPSLIELSKESNAKMFIIEVVGIALGITIMALLSFFEESIQI